MINVNFTKGIHTSSDPINTPEGYYRDAENMRFSGGGKRTEEGNKRLTSVQPTYKYRGSCVIDDLLIILALNEYGLSIIGSLDSTDTWETLVNFRQPDVLGLEGDGTETDDSKLIQVEGRKNWAGENIIYFSTYKGARRINLGSNYTTKYSQYNTMEFDKATKLFLEYELPQTNYVGESQNGELLSGVYQIAARLVTDSLAKTSFGIVSPVIPIVQISTKSERDAIVGDSPQTRTTKSIELSISNVDTTFKYIELGVLTYVGIANTPKLNYTSLIPINGKSIINVTYRGESEHSGSLSLEEFIISGISYNSFKYVTQKDGILLLGALKEAEKINIDWFRVASRIVSKYIVKEIPYNESINFIQSLNLEGDIFKQDVNVISSSPSDNGYKNPMTCALYKGYRRDEVYAFTLTPVFNSGVYGPTVHIPNNNYGGVLTSGVKEAATVGMLGNYISEEQYDEDVYYEADGITKLPVGSGLRLHKFPGPDIEPIIGDNGGQQVIRILGVRFENIVLDSTELEYLPLISGFIIGRVNRKGHETQLAQGIVRPNTQISFAGNNTQTINPMLGDGFYYWELRKAGNSLCKPTGNLMLNDFTFIAPDIIHNLYGATSASHIKQFAKYTSTPNMFPYTFSRLPAVTEPSLTAGFFRNILALSSEDLTLNREETLLSGLSVTQGPFGVPRQPHSKGGKENTTIYKGVKSMQMCSSNGFVWYSTEGDVPIKYDVHNYSNYTEISQHIQGSGANINKFIADVKVISAQLSSNDFVIHTTVRKNTKQYGALAQMTSMFVHYMDYKNPSRNYTGAPIVDFYNGDTFINKYGLTINEEGYYPYPPDDTTESSKFIKPANAAGIIYFWLESSNNYDYRHYITPSSYSAGSVSSSSGSMPFFPAYKRLLSSQGSFGLLNISAENWVLPGYPSQYNNQYSAQPNIKPFTITPIEDITRKASLLNRIIYSSMSVQGEKSDAYQIFLPNNYYDVPQEYGTLTDIFTFRELYATTAQTHWRLFFNTLATQASSVGEIVLGTGGAFNRPAVPITTLTGGYGGLSHWTHGTATIAGRIFVDKIQGKIFVLGEGLDIISQDLADSERVRVQGLKNNEIIIATEPLRERIFIKVGDILWSYNYDQKVFVSRHTYMPTYMFSRGSKLYSYKDTKGFYIHSDPESSTFYDKVIPYSISIAVNAAKTTDKEFKNIELFTTKFGNNLVPLPYSTFDELEVWNDMRYSGKNKIIVKTEAFQTSGILEVLASKVKNSFRLFVPRDVVVNPSINIKNITNNRSTEKWLPRMRGNYIVIKLKSNLTTGSLFLYDVVVDVSENIR